MDNINVYVYGGKNKDEATLMVVQGNEMPQVGQLYTIDSTNGNGFLIVAFPNKDVDTNFEIEFWEE